MTITLFLAITTITLALIFYTVGVFSERHAGSLKLRHIIWFGLGLIFDTTGTTIMSSIANAEAGGSQFSLHQITGMAAILLMAFHFVWAIYVLIRGTEKAKTNFHRFSLLVWLFWLIPYIVGVVIGMGQ
ncbi:HsmA family protein [Lentilactobacillus raoultii]|uniref:HsmA family protein n=1 Tax=Lentilactobacillus raoultii TaxID=1987503 RepID=A0ABW3PGI2_9LACO|nr:HsmA family protein [Lentilactobacillus raoultii]